MKKIVLVNLSLLLFLAVTVIGIVVPYYSEETENRLKSFSSYEELKNFVMAGSQFSRDYYGGWFGLQQSTPAFATTKSAETSNFAGALPDYSTTNIQVEGVDEADIVKTDGQYIYVISERNVTIVKAYPASEAKIISKIRFNGTLKGVFIKGDRLLVFEETSPYEIYSVSAKPIGISYTWRTFIKAYDLADRASPILVRNVSFDGGYVNSRMIGNYVYAIVTQSVYNQSNIVELPTIYLGDKSETVPPTQIYYSNVSDRFETYTHVVSVNLLSDYQEPTHKTYLLGWASTLYVSQGNIYITFSKYQNSAENTIIHKISIENGEIEYQASGEVLGYVLNQFSMDEYNGYFRIATTTGQIWGWSAASSKNHVYILNSNLNIVGRLENLAPGEKIYSARFMGKRGYLVTFKKIDPLFVLDLSNPSRPRVLGQLKVTGYSDYLHPYDETHIIGIGKETVEAEEGNFAWYQGVKISLFDVTDVENPKEIAKYEIGDRGTDSPILRDHKAFLFDKTKNLLVIPVTVAEIDPSQYPGGVPAYAYGKFVWDGAYVFKISLEEGLVLQGKITHMDSAELKIGYYSTSQYSIQRSLYIDDVLYTISDSKIKMNSLLDLTEINQLNLTN